MFDFAADANHERQDWLYLVKVSNERRLKHPPDQTADNLVHVSNGCNDVSERVVS